MDPRLVEVKNGWAAVGDYWAVFGDTEDVATTKFREAEQKHEEISGRQPLPVDDASLRNNPLQHV